MTGSANVLLLPQVSESLAGRMELLTLLPLSQGEQAGWSRVTPALHHYRTFSGREVDIVLEEGAGSIVGVEVKAAATVVSDDFKGLRALAEQAGRRFRRGVVFYTGVEAVPFGRDLHAIPVDALWRLGQRT